MTQNMWKLHGFTNLLPNYLDELVFFTLIGLRDGPIAHQVELPAHNRTVAGSSPAGPKKRTFGGAIDEG